MSRTVRRDLEELLDERFGICVTGDEGQLDELGPMGEPAVGDRGILADSHVGARVIPLRRVVLGDHDDQAVANSRPGLRTSRSTAQPRRPPEGGR